MKKHGIVQICVIALLSCTQSPPAKILSGPWSYRSGNEPQGRGCTVATGWSQCVWENRSEFLFQKMAVKVPVRASLQFMSVDQLVALYVNDSFVFSAGDLDSPSGQLTTGNTLHLVDLPSGQLELCFKIYAPGAFPAVVGDILLDREGILIRNLIKKEAATVTGNSFCFFYGYTSFFCLALLPSMPSLTTCKACLMR